MGAKIAGDDDEAISEINIVPFVDIILVVLIIFMVTTPFIMKPTISVNLPKAASGQEGAPSKLSVTLTEDGKILLNGEPSTTEEIESFSRSASEKNPDIQAVIAADKNVPHGQVVGIIDAVKTGGVKKFAISIDKK